jgi:hypothetical protein
VRKSLFEYCLNKGSFFTKLLVSTFQKAKKQASVLRFVSKKDLIRLSWIRRIFGSRSAEPTAREVTGPVFRIGLDLPKQAVEDAIDELTTMLGVSTIYAFNEKNRLIIEYRSWVEESTAGGPDETIELIKAMKQYAASSDEAQLTNAILRSEKANIILQFTSNLVLFVKTIENINLALASIRVRRVAIALAKILKGEF